FATGSFFSASVGNVLSEKILDRKITVTQMNFWAMTYGVILTSFVVAFGTSNIVIPKNAEFYYALTYLAIFGSVFAFAAYMKLLKNIGSDKAAYVVLIYPIIALLISTIFEGYQWSVFSILGVIVVLIGNAIAMGKLNRLYVRVF
ncbi:MAG: DMT family transporter, partial [Pseudomonadota bacterium]